MKIIIATIKSWNIKNALNLRHRSRHKIMIITNPQKLSYAKVARLKPDYIFFPHWSWKIPPEIYQNFRCVLFHMTDLPYGRGGSPLQNLLQAGKKKTKISAIKVTGEIDAGPVYMKTSLSLNGSAEDIYRRASKLIFEKMIPRLVLRATPPRAQTGRVTLFKRKTPQESLLPYNDGINKIYDHIRMLDAEGYPRAFLEIGNLRMEFYGAKKKGNSVTASVYIRKR